MSKAILLCTVLLLGLAPAVQGVNFVVNQSHDSGDFTCDVTCTLRDAVDDSLNTPSDDTISFAPGITLITLASQIEVTLFFNEGTLEINGPGADVLSIDGGPGNNRILLANYANLVIRDLTFTGGNGEVGGMPAAGLGGALLVFNGTVTVERVHFRANTAVYGGAIFFSGGNHNFRLSTFSANVADECGAFEVGTGTSILLENSTISNNTGTIPGSYGAGFCSSGTVTVRSVSVTDNTSGNFGTGGITVLDGTVDLGNSIVARNNNSDYDVRSISGGVVTSSGFNLIGTNLDIEAVFPAGNPNVNQDIVGVPGSRVDPLLGPLQANGASTPSRAPLAGSPAVDRGTSFAASIDQRGLTRPVDLPTYANGAGNAADIGAVELQIAPTSSMAALQGRILAPNGSPVSRARIRIESNGILAFAVSNAFGYFNFSDLDAGRVYVLSADSKRYTFQPQIITLNGSISGIEIVANP